MKYISRILSAFIMIQLCLVNAPVVQSGVAYAANGSDCPDGQVWSSRNGRCVLQESVIDLKIESGQCEGLTGSDYERCFTNNANKAVDEAEIEQDGESTLQGVADSDVMKFGMPMIASFAAGYTLLTAHPMLMKCASTSVWLILGGAVAGMGTEITAQIDYKNKIDKIQEGYKSRVSSTDDESNEAFQRSTEAQTAALEALAAQEDQRIKTEEIRQIGYTIAAGLYGAAVIAATIEAISVGGLAASSCLTTSTNTIDGKKLFNNPGFYSEFSEYAHIKEFSPAEFLEMIARKVWSEVGINSAHAMLIPPQLVQAIMSISGKGMGAFVRRSMANAVVRGGLAGVLGGYSYVLADQAKRIKENSEKKKAAINEMIVSYSDTGGSAWNDCTAEQRKNPGVPACYCYNDDGTVNQQRKMRQTCFHISNGDSLVAGKYSGSNSGGYTPVKACLQSDGKIDEGCKVCKKKPSLCPTMAKANMGNLSLMKGLGVSNMVDDANRLATGNLSHSDLNVGDLERKAANIEKAKDKLAKDSKTKDIMKKMSGIEDKWNKAAPGLLKKSLQQDPNLLASLGMSKTSPTSKKEDLLKEAKEKVATKSSPKIAEKTAGTASKKDDSSEYDFDFGGGSEGGVEISKDGVMEKEYKITGDIHKNSETNLFHILSLRYQRSGLRRLFDTEGRSKADAASETEIHER